MKLHRPKRLIGSLALVTVLAVSSCTFEEHPVELPEPNGTGQTVVLDEELIATVETTEASETATILVTTYDAR